MSEKCDHLLGYTGHPYDITLIYEDSIYGEYDERETVVFEYCPDCGEKNTIKIPFAKEGKLHLDSSEK